jgi:hypothetical protein
LLEAEVEARQVFAQAIGIVAAGFLVAAGLE